MAKRRKKSRKTSRRKRGMRGLRGVKGNQVGMFLANVLAANLAHEGIDYVNSLDFMQLAPPKAGETAPKHNFKQIGFGAAVFLGGGAGAAMSKNPWMNAIATGIGAGASIHMKDAHVKPALGMGAVADFLNLYKDGEPLKDLGREVELAGIERNLA